MNCAVGPQKHLVAAVGSRFMGDGSEELGRILMKGFLFALSQLDELPETILFYNGGAYLTTECPDSLEDLKAMENQGVEILTCGTCLDYYGPVSYTHLDVYKRQNIHSDDIGFAESETEEQKADSRRSGQHQETLH